MSTPGDGYGQGQQGYGQQGGYGQQPSYGAPGDPTPGWGQPAGGPPPSPKNGLGTAALVFGVLALLSIVIVWVPFVGIVTIVLALLAVILGVAGRGRVRAMRATNGGVALWGLILGVIMLILGVITQILVIFFAVAFLNFGGANSLQQLQDCVNNANNQPNPAAIQQAYEQCSQQFGQQLPQFGGDQPEGG